MEALLSNFTDSRWSPAGCDPGSTCHKGTSNRVGPAVNIRTDAFCGQVGCSDALVEPMDPAGDTFAEWRQANVQTKFGRATFQEFNLTVRLDLFDAPYKILLYLPNAEARVWATVSAPSLLLENATRANYDISDMHADLYTTVVAETTYAINKVRGVGRNGSSASV